MSPSHVGKVKKVVLACSLLASVTLLAAPSSHRVIIGSDGKLDGAASGYAWVAAAQGAHITSPSPCDNRGCFKNTGGRLCTQGTIPALTCTAAPGTPNFRCNWDKDWGVVMGFNTTQPAGPWSNQAPTSVALGYSSVPQGGSAGHFRLNAHVAGDPYSKQYCVDNYTPGAQVKASDLKTECWFDKGDALPNFKQVDTIGLLRVSENAPIAFHFCIDSITTE
jgi:hypothetical protein